MRLDVDLITFSWEQRIDKTEYSRVRWNIFWYASSC